MALPKQSKITSKNPHVKNNGTCTTLTQKLWLKNFYYQKINTCFYFAHDVFNMAKIQWDAFTGRRGLKKKKRRRSKLNINTLPRKKKKSFKNSLQRETSSFSQSSQSWGWAMVYVFPKDCNRTCSITFFIHQTQNLSEKNPIIVFEK